MKINSNSYKEFCALFLPCRNSYFIENNIITSILNKDYYPLERLMNILIQNEKQIENEKTHLSCNHSFNSFEIFEIMQNM